MVKLGRDDMETYINWNLGDETAYISTRMPLVIKHMERIGVEPIKTHTDEDGKVIGAEYHVPRKWLRLPVKPR